jgi:hypothetical protein
MPLLLKAILLQEQWRFAPFLDKGLHIADTRVAR